MKFQIFLIGLVVLMTAGAISVVQSLPTGSTFASAGTEPSHRAQPGAVSAEVETRAAAPQGQQAPLAEGPLAQVPALQAEVTADPARSVEVSPQTTNQAPTEASKPAFPHHCDRLSLAGVIKKAAPGTCLITKFPERHSDREHGGHGGQDQ